MEKEGQGGGGARKEKGGEKGMGEEGKGGVKGALGRSWSFVPPYTVLFPPSVEQKGNRVSDTPHLRPAPSHNGERLHSLVALSL